MYHQANHLALTRQVILQDTRGEGRSPYRNFTTFHYDDFTRDAVALLDHLKIPIVAVVGWSDGAITGLDLAMNYSSRVERVFAHGANGECLVLRTRYLHPLESRYHLNGGQIKKQDQAAT